MQNFRILDSLPVAATPTDDAIGVGSGVLWQNTILPNCPDTGGQHLNYDSATNLFSCGTSGGGGGGGASDFSDLTGTATDAQIPNNITIDLATAATTATTASTATELASNPADCAAGGFAHSIAAGGALTCSILLASAAVNPDGATDDTPLGYIVGTIWINTVDSIVWKALDVTDGAAVW